MKTTAKPVLNALREHILEDFKDGFDTPDAVENLKHQITSMKFEGEGDYQTAKRLVEGGTFLVYYYDINNFMNELDINDKQKDYSDNDTWELYQHLLAREICKLIN